MVGALVAGALVADLAVPAGHADFVVENRRKQGNTRTLGSWRE
jgi:hypothetical protein